MRYTRELRRKENPEALCPEQRLDYHRNVANRQAAAFYRDHGVKEIAPAIETVARSDSRELRVMTTRYCLRRELGACLKKGGASKLAAPLTLRSGDIELRLDFDCANCLMRVMTRG